MFDLSPTDKTQLTEFLRVLVRTPSLSTQEGEVASLIARALRDFGVPEVRVDRIGNVVARLGNGRGPVLLYDGHMDTVAVSDRSAWAHDPFAAEVINGVLYGLGAADMKGALAAFVFAAKMLADVGVELNGSLVFAFVVQEEPCEGLAVRVLIEEEGIKPDWVVLGEPSDLQIMLGQRGRIELRVTAHGQASHAARPDLGKNAIYGAARLIFGLELLADRLGNGSALGRGTLAVTQIESISPSRNAVPDRCSFCIDRRLTLGETEAKALAEVDAIIVREDVAATVEVTEYQATSYTGYECRAKSYFPAWVSGASDPLAQALARSAREALGSAPRTGYWPFSTDGVYTMGTAGIPTVGFGPGKPEHAHTAHDQVRIEDVVKAARVYAQLAVNLLGRSASG
jgi:putative selenium metabolism hydrolase